MSASPAARAFSANTERAYRADLDDFAAWCSEHGCVALPAAPHDVARYLRARAGACAPATVARRLAAIVAVHRRAGLPSPREHPAVREALASVEWHHRDRRRPTVPLDVEALSRMSLCLPPSPAGIRDRALLLVGYGAALRRTELVGLDAGDLAVRRDGALRVRLPRGVVAVPPGSAPHLCAVRAWTRWRDRARLASGPAFRPVDRHGNVRASRLSDRAVTSIVQRAARQAGLAAAYSGRSLRLGMVLAAAARGAPETGIMAQTGHRSRRLVQRYTAIVR